MNKFYFIRRKNNYLKMSNVIFLGEIYDSHSDHVKKQVFANTFFNIIGDIRKITKCEILIMYNLRNVNNLFQMKYFLFIICVTFLLYQSIDLLNEFMSGKTVTTIAYGIIRNTTLPAITLCLKSLDFSKLARSNQNVMFLYRNYLKELENSTTSKIREVDSYWLKTYWGALAMYFNSTSPNININKYILKNLIPFTNQMNETILKVEFHGSVAYGEIHNNLILIDEY